MKLRRPSLDQNGFSLMELMIALAIFGILAAIAVPSYQEHIQRSRRAEAHNALTTLVALQERFFSDYGSYTTELVTSSDPGACPGNDPGLGFGTTSSDGNYTLSVTLNTNPTWDLANCRITANQATAFTITATAAGAQAGDSDCQTITLTSTGSIGPLAACWNR